MTKKYKSISISPENNEILERLRYINGSFNGSISELFERADVSRETLRLFKKQMK